MKIFGIYCMDGFPVCELLGKATIRLASYSVFGTITLLPIPFNHER